ncbi:(d)CMP kinase [Amedibacillus sp. YH-ame10]
MRFNIAIDGPSAAGKSTIAKILAKELGFAHLDTGAMYRCVGYYSKIKGVDQSDEEALSSLIDTMNIEFDSVGNVFINQQDVSKEIRENDISMMASNVSAFPKVREKLVALQQKMAEEKGYILDGRDIGTVVLPDAEVKIYMIASVEARAQRRYDEYIGKHIEANYDEIFKDIEKRDYQDMNRETSPLKKAEDAYEIDTSTMSIEEVVTAIRHLISEKHC